MQTVIEEFKEYMRPGTNADVGFLDEHTLYKFPNNYGVSVIYGKASYGLEAIRIYFCDEDDYTLSHERPSEYLT